MGGTPVDYKSAQAQNAPVVANSAHYDALEKLTSGKYNRGELVLKHGEFAAVNNHVHLTLLNGTVTTKQENLNVRTALNDVLVMHFGKLSASESPALALVKERLLGADNRMMPISRDEVRSMIELLKVVTESYGERPLEKPENRKNERAFAQRVLDTSQILKSDASQIKAFCEQQRDPARRDRGFSFSGHQFGVDSFVKNYKADMLNKDTANVSEYRAYAKSRADMSRTLGTTPGRLGLNQANDLAELVFSRARLFKEDKTFNGFVADFKSRFDVGPGNALTKLFQGLRDRVAKDLDNLDPAKLAERAQAHGRREGISCSPQRMREILRQGCEGYIDELQDDFMSIQSAEIKGGRVVDMEALLDAKAANLKWLIALLLVPDADMVDVFSEELSFDPHAIQERQRQKLEASLKDAGAELREPHSKIAEDLDAWAEGMRNLTAEEAEQKIENVNALLAEVGVTFGEKKTCAEIDLDTLMQLKQTEHLLECKQKCVQAVHELSEMGFSDEVIGSCLEKDLMLVADYSTVMKLAFMRIRDRSQNRFDEALRTTLEKARVKLTEARQERAEILAMKDRCQTCRTDLLKLGKGKGKDGNIKPGDIERVYAKILSVVDEKENDRMTKLIMKLEAFITHLADRQTELRNRIDRLSGLLEEGEERPEPRPVAVGNVDLRLHNELQAFVSASV